MRLIAVITAFILSNTAFAQGLTEQVITEGLGTLNTVSDGPTSGCHPDANPVEGLVRPEDVNAGRCQGSNNRQPLAVNEYRVMTWRGGPGQTSPQPRFNPVTGQDRFYETGNYLLKRPAANRYQVVMNLDISPKPAYPQGATNAQKSAMDAQLKEETLRKIRQCMHTLQPHLKGPGGETMEIRILTPEQTNTLPQAMRPRSRRVEVSPEHNGRGNADNFGTNFTCPTIGHELLHHLGLCDEYLEVEADKQEIWSCRVTPIETSFMKETFYAFDQTVPQTISCDCTDQLCKDAMASDSKLKDLYLTKDSEDILEVNFYLKYCERETKRFESEVPVINGTASSADSAPKSRLGYRSEGPVGAITAIPGSPAVGSTPADPGFPAAPSGIRFVFDRVYPHGKEQFTKNPVLCRCPSGDNYCLNMAQEMKRRAENPPQRTKCPHGTTTRSHTMNTTNGTTGLVGNVLTIQNQGNNQSLLKPNQFKKILAGDCIGQAPDYEKCAGLSNIPVTSDKCSAATRSECTDSFFQGTSAQ